jgi:hypothetical protein
MKVLNKVAYIIAIGFGSGLFPKAPGTAGTVACLLLFIFIPLNWIF